MCFSTFQRLPLCNARRLWFDCARIPCCCIFFSLLVLQKKEERQNWQGIGCAFVGPEKRRRIYISLSMFFFLNVTAAYLFFFLHEVLWLGKSRFQFYSFFFIFVILCRSMTVYEGRAFWRPKKLYGLGFWAGIWALLYDLEYPCGESSALPRR